MYKHTENDLKLDTGNHIVLRNIFLNFSPLPIYYYQYWIVNL